MAYKYEILAKEIVEYLREQKKAGCKTVTISALEIEHMFHVSERCGAKGSSRFPLICQAMHKAAETFSAKQLTEIDPSSTFTVEYKLRIF